jgi:carbonic anhydrase
LLPSYRSATALKRLQGRLMDPLIEGYRKFRAEVWPAERARYEALAHWGQSPEAMVIACSDSRVDPQTVFSAVPGELFVVRNVAALVPPFEPDPGHHGTSAALEFGVKVLKISRLVVLGHGQCGGVKAMAYGAPPQAGDFIASWVEIGKPALLAAGEAPEGRLERIEAEAVRLSLANLMTFPWIADSVAAGRLTLQGYWFDVHTGVLARVDPEGLSPVE